MYHVSPNVHEFQNFLNAHDYNAKVLARHELFLRIGLWGGA